MGLAYLPEGYIRPQLKSGELVRVLDAFCPSYPGFHLYCSSRTQPPLKLRLFIDFLQARRRKRSSRLKGT